MKIKITKKQTNSCDCFVCGKDNKSGIFASFYETEDKTVVSVFETTQWHQSYPEHTHGGIICAMLDETAGRAIWIDEPTTLAVTGSLTVKYHRPVPLQTEVLAVGKVDKNTPRMFCASAKIFDKQNNLLAESTGVYIKQKPSAICNDSNLNKNINVFLPDEKVIDFIEW